MKKETNNSNTDLDFIVCHSEEIDTEDAVKELIEQAESKLNGRIPNACILFSAIDYEFQTFLDEITMKWNGIQLVGGTTDGEMSSELGFAEDSVVMLLFKSDSIVFSAGVGDSLSEDIDNACKKAVVEATEGFDSEPRLCFTIPGNVGTQNDKIIASLKNLLNDKVPIFGGVPGDQWRFKVQYQFCGNKVYTDSVPILLFSGSFVFEYGVDSGWIPLGEPGKVTKTEGNIVYEINNKPAIDFYKNSLGELNEAGPEFPILVLNEQNNILFQRTPFQVLTDQNGAIVFLGEINLGAKVQIANAPRDTIIDGSRKSINDALNKLGKDPKVKGCLFISCAGRKLLLGTRTKDEIATAREILGNDVPMAGFYSYSEVCPLKMDPKNSALHNQTFITLLFG
ncbi:MAG: FIST N-terminal domain-containing protein [Candidatus Tenebribacter mawsonii]|nr:FIST N-terminal domain-containing protein [Candidatus Tenebribacter mawsonii]